MLFKLYFLICSISSFFDDKSHFKTSLITDRRIKRLIGDNIVKPSEFMLRKNIHENQKVEMFIWDKHFPKPFFYILEGEVSLTPYNDLWFVLKFFSIKQEEIYQIKINNKSYKIVFYDENKNIKHIKGQNNLNNKIIITNNEGGDESLIQSVVYINNIKCIENHYSTLCSYFDLFLNELRIFMNKTKKLFGFNEQIFSKSWEVEMFIVKMINKFVKSFSSLKIPALNKLDFLIPSEDFRNNVTDLTNLIKNLIIVINIEVDKYHEHDIEIDFTDLTYFRVVAAYFIEEIKKGENLTINEIYKNYLNGMKCINDYIEEIKKDKNNNIQITLDCDIMKVDKFLENYSSYLIEYCEILDKFDDIYLNEYFYYQNEYYLYNSIHKFESYLTPLLETFTDIAISKEMRNYISNYKNDKTDFLIFTQSDYFLNKMTHRMIKNSKDLSSAFELKKKIDSFFQGKLVELTKDDQIFMRKIVVLQQKLIGILYIDNRSIPLTFNEIIDNITVNTKDDVVSNLSSQVSYTKDNINNRSEEKNKNLEISFKNIISLTVIVFLLCFIIYLIVRALLKLN